MSSDQRKALHAFHKSLKLAVDNAVAWTKTVDAPNLPDVLKDKLTTILTRLSTAKTMAETSFPDGMASITDVGSNDGPAALVQSTQSGGARLFIFGVLIRSVGTDVEVAAIRRQAAEVNAEADAFFKVSL